MITSASNRLTRGEIIGSVLVFVLVLVFGRLCLWQVSRLHERRAENAAVAARLDAPPLAGLQAARDTSGALYRRVRITGRFDDDRSIVLPGRSYNASPGVYVITPALLPDGTGVLVNRGWVPSPDASTVDLSKVRSNGGGELTGLLLPFPTRRESTSLRADSTAPAGTFKRVWYTIDEKALRSQFPYPLAPVMLQLLPEDGVAGIPRRLPPPPLDEGPHLSYAIQWFCFAVISLVGWIVFLMRRRSDRAAGRTSIAPPHPPRI